MFGRQATVTVTNVKLTKSRGNTDGKSFSYEPWGKGEYYNSYVNDKLCFLNKYIYKYGFMICVACSGYCFKLYWK